MRPRSWLSLRLNSRVKPPSCTLWLTSKTQRHGWSGAGATVLGWLRASDSEFVGTYRADILTTFREIAARRGPEETAVQGWSEITAAHWIPWIEAVGSLENAEKTTSESDEVNTIRQELVRR